ncbi:MAG: iron-containing alcohol dehydrogenase [Clostridia bacterium]|nr:iron-containing alcohol dehydrogenase [Clostridia bacterium]
MNLLKKLWCRTFQAVFHLAIPILPYRDPQILREMREIPDVLKKNNAYPVLIVTDVSLHAMGATQPLIAVLQNAKIPYTVYDKTVPNPTVQNVEEARMLYLENNCRGIIGFGGGSPIDCAKAVGARIAKPWQSIPKMKGILKIWKKTPFMMAIPTTAGTGSEVTLATVITNEKTHHKFPINDFPLIPNCCVLDAENTRHLPKNLTATTGMDAMTHAVEAYIGGSTTKSTRADATRAVNIITNQLENAYRDGNDMHARAEMLEAAFLAGRAFSKSYVGYCHAVAHTLGGKYNTPHGLANAVLLPHVLRAYGTSAHKKLKQLAIAAGLATQETAPAAAANAFIEKLEQMNRAMNIPKKLPGICREDIPILAKYAEKEANPLYPVPRLMTARELEQFYYQVMEESR